MSAFDYVIDVHMDCPGCGKPMEFDSKDGECESDSISFRSVDGFADYCDCGSWVEFSIKPNVEGVRTLDDYDKVVHISDKEKQDVT